MNDEEVRLSRSIESEISSKLGELSVEVGGNRVVLDVGQDESELVEDVREEGSVLSLDQKSSLVEELSSISRSRLVVKHRRVSNGLHDELSEALQPHSGFRVLLHSVEEQPVSSLELVHSSNSSEFLEDDLKVLPDSVVLGSRESGSSSSLSLHHSSLFDHMIHDLEEMVDSSRVLWSASKLREKRNESIPESVLLMLRNDLFVSKLRSD